ncbi:MAG: DotH/IcmK family type IV secretion protein [Enterobacterales bacterium]|nr:DotH/IcmK family type IV secretion protein [Enterobacterales bacterium]
MKFWIIYFAWFILSSNLWATQLDSTNPPSADELASYASQQEMKFIESQLANLENLSEIEKQQLRRLIIDIKIRESKNIAENEQRLKQVQSEIKQQQWIASTFQTKPENIIKTRQLTEEVDRAQQAPIFKVTHLNHTLEINLNEPKAIDIPIAINWGATIIFVDRFGSPFPIQSIGDFTGNKFTLNSTEIIEQNNVLTVINNISYTKGNASIFLAGQNLPLMLTFTSNQEVNTSRLIIRVQQISPLTQQESIKPVSAEGVNRTLYQIADYQIPADAKSLYLSHNIGNAWLKDGFILLRTPYLLLSPYTPEALESHTNGIENVYRLPFYSQMLLNINSKKVMVSVSKEPMQQININQSTEGVKHG